MAKNAAEAGMIQNMGATMGAVSNYCRWNISFFPIEREKRILDIGSGPCYYLDAILELHPELYCATDYSDAFLDIARERMSGYSSCRAEHLDILRAGNARALEGQRFDYVLCFDVLEHLEDDVKALQGIRRIMADTGARSLFVRVPAMQFLFGENDRAIGHFRRYNKAMLKDALAAAGFGVRKAEYQNFVGTLPWFIIGRVLRRSLAVSNQESRLFDRLVPVLWRIESLIKIPFGLSLYCIAEPRKGY